MAGPLSYALTLSTSGFTGGVNTAKGALGGFKSVAGGTVNVLGKIVAPLAAITAGAGLAATALGSMSVASDMEQTTVGLNSLIGSVAKTTVLLKEVKSLSASTPFKFPELANSARTLAAMDLEASKIPTALKRIGDVASAVQAPIGELATLYGRAKNDGVLYTETLNQLNDRGIPVFTELGKIMGKSNTEIKKMASEGKVTFPLLEQSFINLTKEGGKFHGMMEAQSQTNAGLLSTLKDGATELMLVIGTPINDALKPILKQAIELVKRVGLGLTGVVDIAKAAIAQGRLGELVSKTLIIGLKEAGNYAISTFVFMGEMLLKSLELGIKLAIEFFTGGFNESIGNIASGLFDVFTGIGQLILSKVGDPFRTVAAFFQAGLEKAINFVLAELSATKLGSLLGLEVEHEDFDKLLNEAKGKFSVGALQNNGKRNIEQGLERAGRGLTQGLSKGADLAKEVFAGTKFEKINIFDIKKDTEALGLLSKQLSPEGFQKVMDALNPPAATLKDAAKTTKDAVEKADDLDKAVKLANTKKPVKQKAVKLATAAGKKEEKQTRGLFSAAESLQRRFSRQAKGSASSFKNFVNRSKLDRGTFSKGKLGLRASASDLGRGVSAAGKRRQLGKKENPDAKAQATQETTLAVLKRIEGKFANIATA